MQQQRSTWRRSRIWGGFATLVCLGLGFFAATDPADAADFVVIVNSANAASFLREQEVSEMFLKKSPRWTDGVRVAPVDLDEGSSTRESFSQAVHRKSTAAIKAYWQKMIFSGREVPPPEKGSAAEVVSFVKANRGAIGYVSAGTAFGPGVKILSVSK